MHARELLTELERVSEPTRPLVLETADGRVLPLTGLVESSTVDSCGDGLGILVLKAGSNHPTSLTVAQLIADLATWERSRQIWAEDTSEVFFLEYTPVTFHGPFAILASEPN